MSIPADPDLACAIAAARAAGEVALAMQASAGRRTKADGSPVTDGDLAADAAIRRHLPPGDAILSEEITDDPVRLARSRVWIIDPIDGTRDYAAGEPTWTVQVALVVDGDLRLGVLDMTGLGVRLVGVIGVGTWIDHGDGWQPILADCRHRDCIVASASARNHDSLLRLRACLPEFANETSTSVGLKVWRLLQAGPDLYPHIRDIYEWDAAAPAAVLLAAGGTATDAGGRALPWNTPDAKCRGLLYSTRSDHQAIAARLSAAGLTP